MDLQEGFGFLTDAHVAITRAIQTNTVLVVYATDEDNHGKWLQSWAHPRLMTNENMEKKTTFLIIVKGTPEFQQLQELFPNIHTQSLYFIKNQKIELIITGDSGSDKFSHWNRIIDYLEGIECTPVTDSTVSTNRNQTSTVPIPVTNPTPVNNVESIADTNPEADVAPNKTPINNKKTFKEEVNDLTRKKYHEQMLKQKQLERSERQRILRLVESDRQERLARKLQEEMNKKSQKDKDKLNELEEIVIKIENPDINDNIKNLGKLEKLTECTLQIRLTNGQSIVNKFDADSALTEVRSWVNENRSDGKCSYLFHRNVPRATFSIDEEEKSLRELELIPRSALILEQIDNNCEDVQPGLLGRITNRLAFWRASPQSDLQTNTESCTSTEENDTNNTANTKEESSDSKNSSSSYKSPSFRYVTQLNTVESDLNLAERSVSPNVRVFANDTDEHKSDEDRPSYNGNNINLENKKDD
ncbi:hypothetical protein TPHA_0I02600 [Tetrapisispora phaffii CBS 4417]|uniref:UBX domain-containing protein n=1 Tax=Tetrapisispora phaffii (strain ATCC 24235 / CBS 4417 / NBRC 1672 / NRRL Y-8282 / UCD 70-5) TaxID=1071381 RepID=G8BXY3_TETPH|nr:hypothetical protein TPHA_0I02600 [Tetrapisispora phaffii CBS 4417]CCE64761.1 hypothetical protein TPHA_0I02600 [Tetrapisispora phaffii CBS 4417]